AILAQHPEVRSLYGHCTKTKYVCTLLVVSQLTLAWLVRDAPLWVFFLVAYAVGGFISQWLLLANHELSHDLAFEKPLANRLFGLFINLPIGVPVVAAFRDYHLMHHAQQGVDGVDTDVPTAWEARWIRGPLSKIVWLMCQGLAYALRPVFMMPLRPHRWLAINVALQIAFDVAVYLLWGGQALAFLPVSALLSMGLHPMAGHYLTEHYVVASPQETYSYYGPLNALAFNVGYHNEHHDFPAIAGSRLPELKRMAPEFYDDLVQHRSWPAMLWRYVLSKDLDARSRIKRARVTRPSPED
ncbi:MAG TPA: fatty acid desaturase, partial [Polyangiaceae bacterium]|nr:fatty acid desaturase [Polyangiaceae bacterium]